MEPFEVELGKVLGLSGLVAIEILAFHEPLGISMVPLFSHEKSLGCSHWRVVAIVEGNQLLFWAAMLIWIQSNKWVVLYQFICVPLVWYRFISHTACSSRLDVLHMKSPSYPTLVQHPYNMSLSAPSHIFWLGFFFYLTN